MYNRLNKLTRALLLGLVNYIYYYTLRSILRSVPLILYSKLLRSRCFTTHADINIHIRLNWAVCHQLGWPVKTELFKLAFLVLSALFLSFCAFCAWQRESSVGHDSNTLQANLLLLCSLWLTGSISFRCKLCSICIPSEENAGTVLLKLQSKQK